MNSHDVKRNVVYVFTHRPDDLTWRRIIFLPFNFYWRVFLALSGFIHCNLIMYEEVFIMDRYTHQFRDLMTLWRLLYLIDFVLSFIHRMWEGVQKSMSYHPKSIFVLTIDLLSLLPIRGFFSEPLVTREGSINLWKLLSMMTCLRIYSVFKEIINLRDRMDLNPIVVSLIQHNVLMLSLSSLFCAVWYALGYIYQRSPKSWLSDYAARNTFIDMDHPTMAYVVSFMHVLVLLNNSIVMDIRAIRTAEKAFMSLMMFSGFLLQFCYMTSSLVNSFLKYQRHLYMIKDHITINKKCSNTHLHKAIETYYVSYWKDWLGLQMCPNLDMFPLCLRKDVLTDMYWDAIEHSHLLRHFTINVKRQISLQMESKFMQPGDYIFRKGQVRNSFYYIASGVVQIMSFYDGISPIITISSGSCLGCFALVIPSPSPTDVICATECEVRILTYKGYFTALSSHRDAVQLSYDIICRHIEHAKLVYTVSKTTNIPDAKMKMYGIPQDDKLKWIKRRWRALNSLGHNEERLTKTHRHRVDENVLPIELGHTSKYMDLLVLKMEEKWDANKCCFKTKFPYTLEPDCNFVKMWLIFIVVLVTIDCIILPYRVAYLPYESNNFEQWDHIILFAYLLDIYFQVITIFRSVEETITDSTALLRYHLKKITFIIDILATIPLCWITNIYDQNTLESKYLGLHRLLKLVRVYEYFKYQWGLITAPISITHVLKTAYVFIMILYISASLAFIMACRIQRGELVCIKNSWFERLPNHAFMNMDNVYVYIVKSKLYVGGLFSMSNINVMSELFSNIVFLTGIIFIGRMLIIFSLAELMSMWILKRLRLLAGNELVTSFRTIAQRKALHAGLQNMVIKYLKLQWKVNKGLQLLESSSSEVFCPIVTDDHTYTITKAMQRVEFLRTLSDEMFRKLHQQFRLYFVPRGYIFCRAGEKPSCFNILLKGCCNITSMIKEDLLANPHGRRMIPFESFSLQEILQNIESLHTTESLTVCKVVTIEAIILQDILFNDKFMKFNVRQAMYLRNAHMDVVVSKKKYKKVQKQVPSFLPVLKQPPRPDAKYTLQAIHPTLFNRLKVICGPLYIINPAGTFAYMWETVKVIQVVSSLLFLPYMLLYVCEITNTMFTIALFLDGISFLDIFLRFHLGSYNKEGLVVLKKWYYLSHAFLIDFISSLPVYLILYGYNLTLLFYATMATKMLQIYRISGFIYVSQYRFKCDDFKTVSISFAVHTFLILYILACCLFCYSCHVVCEEERVTLSCRKGTWMESQETYTLDNSKSLILSCLFIIISVISGSDIGDFRVQSLLETLSVLLLTVVALAGKGYFVPKIAAQRIGGNTQFTKHRENLKQFRLFIRNQGGDKDIAGKIMDHFIHVYERLKGLDMDRLITSAHPSISTDLSFAMYYNGIKCLHRFVGESKSFMRMLSRELKELYFLENNTIIGCNELNMYIYFVCNGTVGVLDKDGETIKKLKPGSMFGALSGRKCHKYRYESQMNACILQINTIRFMKLFKLYNVTDAATFSILVQDKEYITMKEQHSDNSVTCLPTVHSTHDFLFKGSMWNQIIMFLLSVVVPYITIFPLLNTVLFNYKLQSTALITILYSLDIVMCLRIFFGLNTTYTDKETSVYMSNLKHIRIEYMTRPSGFILDVISLFPIEIVWYLIKHKWVDTLRLNRVLRLMMMISHALEYRDTAFIRPWMRWCEYIAHVTLGPYIVIVFWLYLTCYTSCIDSEGQLLTEPFETFAHAMKEAVMLMTFSASSVFTKPTSDKECISLIILIFFSYTVLPLLVSGYTQRMDTSNYTRKIYEYKMYCIKLYLQLRGLSNSLLEQLWNYSLLLWATDKGQYMPKYLMQAPSNLKCQLMYDLYGGHIRYNVLFENCDPAFLFQLVGYLKRTIYFPGDVIIRKFDVDDCMYFINSGEVEGIQFDDMNKEIVEDVFITGECFGLAQGLVERQTHEKNYIARNTVELLVLDRKDCMELLDAYPKDKQKIFENAGKLDILDKW